MTKRQQQVYDFIAAFIRQQGQPPTLQEIAAHLKISGNLGVMRHLAALEKKGWLKRVRGRSRGIVLTRQSESLSLPLIGQVAAGPLTEAWQQPAEFIEVDRSLVRSDDSFLLRVSGDSMIGAHICDGDLAVVRPQKTAENGDIVVAAVAGEATLKRFYRESGRVRLQPENPALSAIILDPQDGELALLGKVTGIIRQLDL